MNRTAPREPTAPDDSLYALTEDSGRTDAANAVRFIDENHGDLLYVPPWKKWLSWDGRRWHDDAGVAIQQRAKRYAESLWLELGEVAPGCDRNLFGKVQTFVKRTNERAKINDFIALAASDYRVVCQVADLNANPMLMNCKNGTLDLTTGELRPHDPADRITQLAPVAYDCTADCPRWLETLELIFDGDGELVRYVQQLLGYSISGDTGEHILPIAYGSGCNGKSTIWNAVIELLGDYGWLANDDLLLGERKNHQTEKASLYQKRFVAISEPEKNASLRESRVKELTGDRTITARRMHEDFWPFERTHTFWLSTNHLPRIDGTDEGIWRRVKLIPFTVDLRKATTPIPDLDRWLVRNEGAGILAWLVRGFADWRENGFVEPACVTNATGAYRADSDALGDFLNDCCIVARNATVTHKAIYDSYREWGGKWSKTAFGKSMAERFTKDTEWQGANRGKTVYQGVGLRCSDNYSDDSENPAKTRENDDCKQLQPVADKFPMDLPNSREDFRNYLQPLAESENLPPRRCDCGAELTPSSVVVRGWRNWDCVSCGAIVPTLEGGQ